MTLSYAAKPWTERYDQDVPKTLKPYPTYGIPQLLRNTAQKMPNNPASMMTAHLPILGRQKASISYRELDALSDAMASALISLGVKKGDRVMIIMPNVTQFPIAFYGILKAGGIVCACNPTYPADKIKDMLKDCGAEVAITLSLFYNSVKQIQNETALKQVIVTSIKEYLPPAAAFLFGIAKEKKEGHYVEKHPVDHWFQDLLKQHAGKKSNVEIKPEDTALFQYTGGTTGVPKAAVATHAALVANAMQIFSFMGNKSDPKGEIFLAAIPMFHVFGMVAVLSLAVSIGGLMIMVPNPRNIEDILEVIHTMKPTIYMGVPAMYNAINNHKAVAENKYDLKSIRICISGSAPLAPVTKEKFEKLTGGKLVEGFGMSETPTAVCCNPVFGVNKAGSIGLPLPDVEVDIVSLDDGQTSVEPGKVGELLVWSPNLMKGYHNMPGETDNALRQRPDGRKWMYTGDIAYMDQEGYLFIVDRKKDMVLIGGFNVYPANVEKRLLEHPAVQEVGVAAIEHPSKPGQEALKAWVVLKPDMKATSDELIKFAEDKLARYEVPPVSTSSPICPRPPWAKCYGANWPS
jgi:long-chain acyl-CoA synthetase